MSKNGKQNNRRFWRQEFQTVLANSDAFDLWDWRRAVKQVPQLGRLNRKARNEFPGQPGQDVFLSLYQERPEVQEKPPAGLEPLASLMKKAMETPAWLNLHADTTGDILTAAFGAKALVDEVFRNIPDEVKEEAMEHQRRVQEQQDAQEQAQDLRSMAEKFEQAAAEAGEGQEDGGQADADADAEGETEKLEQLAEDFNAQADQLEQVAEQMGAEAEASLETFDNLMDQFDARIRAAFNEAAETAGEEATDMAAFVKGFTEAAGGDPSNVPPDIAEKAMKALRDNENLKDLASLLGWAQRTVDAERRLSPHGGHELTGMTFGPLDLGRAAGQEIVALASEEDSPLYWDVLRRVVDNSVLLREYQGEEDEAGKGTMVLVRDESGSMIGAAHAMAVAIEWSMLNAARKDGRKFISIPFSGTNQFSVWEAPDSGKADPDGLLKHLSHFYGGGTEPYKPLLKALEIIEQRELKADILCLTDAAIAQAPDDFLDKLAAVKERVPLRIETVVIGSHAGRAEAWSDRTHLVNDLLGDREKLREAFQGVM